MWLATQLAGVVCLLGAYAVGTRQQAPNTLWFWNALGATMLAASAIAAEQWGFVLLNACWLGIAIRDGWHD